MSAGSPSAPLESGHGKWLIFHRCLKLLMWKIFLGEVCLAMELLPLSPFCRDCPVPTGYPVVVFHIAAAQDRHFGAVSPSSEVFFLIPALRLPGLVTNAPFPLDCSRNAFSSKYKPGCKRLAH